MAKANTTATTPEALAEQFPGTNRPFAVWYNSDKRADHHKCAVNDETGIACADFSDTATALKTAAEMGKEWDDEARNQARALARVVGADSMPNPIGADLAQSAGVPLWVGDQAENCWNEDALDFPEGENVH